MRNYQFKIAGRTLLFEADTASDAMAKANTVVMARGGFPRDFYGWVGDEATGDYHATYGPTGRDLESHVGTGD